MKYVLVGAGLAVLVLSVYWPVYGFDFVNFDDDVYLVDNARVAEGLSPANRGWAFTTGHHSNWHPVTWLSWFLDVELFGTGPAGFHVMNVAIHLANVLLLYGVLAGLTGMGFPAALAAALLAIHPVHVESVAWISERKDVLSMFFLLVTVGLYGLWARRRGAALYAGMLVAYALGLMSKPMLVTLPLLLVLLDAWPLGRLNGANVGWRLLEKAPFCLLAAGSAVVTYRVQAASGAVRSAEAAPLVERVWNAVASYVLYLASLVNPTRLAVFYPRDIEGMHWMFVGACGLALLTVTVVAIRYAGRWPHVAVGWFWYLIALGPVIGLVQVGEQARADRYLYVPALGIYVAVAWSVAIWLRGSDLRRRVGVVGLAGVMAVLLVLGSMQVSYWRNSETLFSRAVAVTEGNYLAHNNLGVAVRDFDAEAALGHFRAAVAAKGDYRDGRVNLASGLLEAGEYEAAVAEYLGALELGEDAVAYSNLAIALQALGRDEEAIGALRSARRIDAEDLGTVLQLADALRAAGDYREAATHYRWILRRVPIHREVELNLAVCLLEMGEHLQAEVYLRQLVLFRPRDVGVRYNLGVAFAANGAVDEAIEAFEAVLRLEPGHGLARANLDVLLTDRATAQ